MHYLKQSVHYLKQSVHGLKQTNVRIASHLLRLCPPPCMYLSGSQVKQVSLLTTTNSIII